MTKEDLNKAVSIHLDMFQEVVWHFCEQASSMFNIHKWTWLYEHNPNFCYTPSAKDIYNKIVVLADTLDPVELELGDAVVEFDHIRLCARTEWNQSDVMFELQIIAVETMF